MSNNHSWKFFRAGGFDQVRLDAGADLVALEQLDQKLWVALACPTTGLEFDARTLGLIDTDKDGRIRAPELIAAVKWAAGCLKNPDDLTRGTAELPLSAINDAAPEGKQLLASARHILTNLGKQEAVAITLEDTADTAKIFAQTRFNGDGIIPADSAEDAATGALISDILACLGPETDRSGKPGINQAKADLFFAQARAYSDWWKLAETNAAVLPLAGATEAAAAALKKVRPKIDDYFTRCRLAAFDPRAVNALNREEKEYLQFGGKDLSPGSVELAGFPISRIEAGKPLPLHAGLNPAWARPMAQAEALALLPLLGKKEALTEADWAVVVETFAAYEGWLAAKPANGLERLGLPRLRELLAGPGKDRVAALIARDKALEPESNAIAAVEKLIRYYRDLYRLVNNFVCFRDFYGRKEKAIFQAGTLYLDQRSCELCLTVEDSAKHALMASLAGTFLAYCDCVRKATGEKLSIVAAFTGGDSDNLMVGRNGIFYDRKGRDWDATITKLIDNPISISQAFWAPYKKLIRLIEEQVARRAAAADAAVTTQLQSTAQTAVSLDKPPVEPPKRIDPGTLAAIGLVLTTLLGALGTVFAHVLGLPWWQIPLAILGMILAISCPSMVIATLKLHKRNLGPILDANGWAVNAKATINVPFGASLTSVAVLPPGAQRDLVDPFAEKKRPWWLYITTAIVIALIVLGLRLGLGWYQGKYDGSLPHRLRSTTVLGTNAPAYVAPGHAPAAPEAPAAAQPAKAPSTN